MRLGFYPPALPLSQAGAADRDRGKPGGEGVVVASEADNDLCISIDKRPHTWFHLTGRPLGPN
jgi:hypothetical protein